eukprot:gene8369-12908_t
MEYQKSRMAQREGTIVIDNLPEQCTTIQLLAAFRCYGAIMRAWRSHGCQGLVTFEDQQCALAAVEHEDNKVINEKVLRVTAAFTCTAAVPRKGWWQCSLCGCWNEHKPNQNVCIGYMCGIKFQEGGIVAIEKQLDSLDFQNETPAPGFASPYDAAAGPSGAEGPYYPGPGYQSEYQPPYEPQDEQAGMQTMPPANYSRSYNPYSSTPEQVAPHSPVGPPPQYSQHSYHHAPPTVVPQSRQRKCAQSAEIQVDPPQPQLNYHCVIVANVPTNITDRTLNKVFAKFSPTGGITSWVKPTNDVAALRPLAEGQVLFPKPVCAQQAIEGESGRDVDNEKIWCKYVEELFVVAVQGTDLDAWCMHLASPELSAKRVAELTTRFGMHGRINAVRVHEKTVFVEYFSLTSALEAICAEDGRFHAVSLARSGTRWPCVCCLRINSPGCATCETQGCGTPKQHIDARLMKEAIQKAVSDPGFGYCVGLQGYIGTELHDTARDVKGKPPQQGQHVPTSPSSLNGAPPMPATSEEQYPNGAADMGMAGPAPGAQPHMQGANGNGQQWRGSMPGTHKGAAPHWNRGGRGGGGGYNQRPGGFNVGDGNRVDHRYRQQAFQHPSRPGQGP